MYNLVDLFSGAGGITTGFSFDLGANYPEFTPSFRSVLAIDNNKDAIQTYETNFGSHGLAANIEQIIYKTLPDGRHRFSEIAENGIVQRQITIPQKVHVVVGGPPCQGFSQLGRMNNWDREDPRNLLWQYFIQMVKRLEPDIFLMENVPQLLTSKQGQEILNEAHKLGYFLAQPKVLDASLYGVPQKRKRAFILGSRIGPIELPEPTFEMRTVRDAFANLPEPSNDPLFILRNPRPMSLERYQVIPEGGNRFDLMKARPDITPRCWLEKPTGSTDVMGRLWWDKPSLTIRTEFFKPEKGRYLHPNQHRPITHREAAALQTFPHDFEFTGSKIEIARQIGNAVPPVLSFQIATNIHARLQDPLPVYGVNKTPNLVELKKKGLLRLNRNRNGR